MPKKEGDLQAPGKKREGGTPREAGQQPKKDEEISRSFG